MTVDYSHVWITHNMGTTKTSNSKYLFIDYLKKIGPQMSEVCRGDKRMYPDGIGGTTFRGPTTWEEAHKIVVEFELMRRDTQIISPSRD